MESQEANETSLVLPEIQAADLSFGDLGMRDASNVAGGPGGQKGVEEETRIEDIASPQKNRRPSKISFNLPSQSPLEISEIPSLLYRQTSIVSRGLPPPLNRTDEEISEDKEFSERLVGSTGEGDEKSGEEKTSRFRLPGLFRSSAQRKRESLDRDEAFSRIRDLLRAEQDVIVVRSYSTSCELKLIDLVRQTGTTILILSLVFAVLAIWFRHGHDPRDVNWLEYVVSPSVSYSS